jgi:hypothetical protein
MKYNFKKRSFGSRVLSNYESKQFISYEINKNYAMSKYHLMYKSKENKRSISRLSRYGPYLKIVSIDLESIPVCGHDTSFSQMVFINFNLDYGRELPFEFFFSG